MISQNAVPHLKVKGLADDGATLTRDRAWYDKRDKCS